MAGDATCFAESRATSPAVSAAATGRQGSAQIYRQNSLGSSGSKESNYRQRAQSCIERLQQFELWRHAENAKRRASEEKRRERLQSEASQRQEEAAKRSLQAMMKRQLREAETCQREAARTSVLAKRQEARERRAEERKMQQMKQRELQRELSSLRDINRAMDIERQRRREETQRETFEEALRRKCERAELVAQEKQRLWCARRQDRIQREEVLTDADKMSRTPIAVKRRTSKLSMALTAIASAPTLP